MQNNRVAMALVILVCLSLGVGAWCTVLDGCLAILSNMLQWIRPLRWRGTVSACLLDSCKLEGAAVVEDAGQEVAATACLLSKKPPDPWAATCEAEARQVSGPMAGAYQAFCAAARRDGHTFSEAAQLWRRSTIRRVIIENMSESERKRRKYTLDEDDEGCEG